MLFSQNIALHFAGTYLFENVSFRINREDRIGLVGKNGAGKSTLLKILARTQPPSEGSISLEGNVSIGYLKQDLEFENDKTLWEEVEQAFVQIKQLEGEINSINQQLIQRTDYESDEYKNLIEKVSSKTEYFNLIGGYTYEAQMEQILLGLGFKRTDFDRSTQDFSGGWRMRIELAKLLLQQHDVLLLDEPTNHLDIESILWLENFLIGYKGAVVLISHDIQFLDNVTNRTLEIANRKLTDFAASYKRYLVLKAERQTQLLAQQKNQEKSIKHTEQLIEKFRAKASKASMAQSLMKKLDRIDRIEVENDDINTMKAAFDVHKPSGKIVLTLEDVAISFGEKSILSGIDMLITRGEKVAFVGQNGQGKTTLARIIVGELACEGMLKLGHNVMLGYFAQNHETDDQLTVLESAERAATAETFKKVRNMLGAFLFTGDDVYKKLCVLSGGERGRLALCNLLLNPFNTLVLDEPTNHLDVQSKNILKSALQQFDGTLIIVSHDRDFMEDLIDRIYEFRDGQVRLFLGGITDFLAEKKMDDFRELEKKITPLEDSNIPDAKKEIVQKEDRKNRNKLAKLEQEITALETDLKQMEQTLATDDFSENIFLQYEDLKRLLQDKMQTWENLSNLLA